MSFRLTSQIQLGDLAFSGGVHEVKINRSVKELIDTAKIKLPAAGRISNTLTNPIFKIGNPSAYDLPPSSVATSTLWKEGDKVNILLGYNNAYRQEFKGFVRRVSPSIPALIECEGYAWQLRKKPFIGSWKSINLRDFLHLLTADTDITIHPKTVSLPLTNLCIKNGNALNALEYLKTNCHLAAYFQFDVLYVGLEEGIPGSTVSYRLGWNVIKDDKLKWRLASSESILVRLITSKGRNKKPIIVTSGDKGGELVDLRIGNIAENSNLQAIADQALAYRKYTGYEGSITGFLQPACSPSDTAKIIDNLYHERDGLYFVEGTEVIFGMNGAQRVIHISRALSVPKFEPLIDADN